MAITAYEMYNSRSFKVGKDTQEGRLEYVINGSKDEAAIKAALLAVLPATFPGIAGLVKHDVDVRYLGGLLWHSSIPYMPDDAPLYPAVGGVGPPLEPPLAPGLNTPLGADFAFDLTAETEHVTQSIATISKTKRGGGVAPDNKRAIGITQDGEVKGCDRFKPKLEWSVTKTFTSITMQYLNFLENLVGTVNNAVFYGRDTGTTMFLGASGNTKDIAKAVVTFKFASQKHRVLIEICDGLTVPAKKAWEYLWIAYKNVDDANKITQQPDSAYVEQIYEDGNYVAMGIG